MPGRGVLRQMETPSPNFAHFKSHKTLPRSNTQSNNRSLPNSTIQNPFQVHTVDILSARSSERIRSWIQEPFVAHTALDREIPLTPPIISLDLEDDHWIHGPALTNYLSGADKITTDNDSITPLVQQTPPTPETTPPRITPSLAPFQAARDPSLRTGSFETARENPSSDGEETSLGSPSLRPTRQQWPRNSGRIGSKGVGLGLGLGLGLESDGDDEKLMSAKFALRNSTKTNNLAPSSRPRHEAKIEVEYKETGLESEQRGKLYVQPRLARTRPRVSAQMMPRSEMIDEGAGSPLVGSQSLRQRLGRSQHHTSASIEQFAADIDWPFQDEELDFEAKLRDVDSRRFSQISATSTIVEAMVIDSKPRRRQTLRHTGKVFDFKTESPRVSPSDSSLIMPDNMSRRRLSRNHYSPDRGRRRSVATDTSGSAASVLVKVQQGVINQKPRPTTAPQEKLGYFDIPQREHPTLPTVADTWTSKPDEPALTNNYDDVNHALLSAPPAIEEPLEFVAAPSTNGLTLVGQPQAILHLSDPSDAHGVNLDRPKSGEWSALRPRSALFTPFSLRSAHSSTPGTLEVNEATAISIYPHTNKSILVIQEIPGNGLSETSAIIAGNANIALPVPLPPVVIEEFPPRPHSPLQNPREPPKPPDLNIIPPTPSNGPRTPEADFQLPQSSPKNRLSGTISVVKRAISTRRYSAPSVLPRYQSLARNNTVPSRHRSGAGSAQDHSLHPFWRPRGFWDGLSDDSDSDSEFGNSGHLAGAPSQGPPRSPLGGSLSSRLPLTRQLSRSASLTRRLASSFGLNKTGNHHRRPRMEHWLRTPTGELNPYNDNPPDGTRTSTQLGRRYSVGATPLHGSRTPFVKFKALAQKVEKALNSREEGKREKVREKLRGSIDVIRGDGIQASGRF